MWNEGKNIAQIAKARELKESTIISHIEKLAKNKQIGRGDLSRLLTPTLANNLSEIHALFCEVGLERLSPVFEELAGKYSYDELRIARMMYQK